MKQRVLYFSLLLLYWCNPFSIHASLQEIPLGVQAADVKSIVTSADNFSSILWERKDILLEVFNPETLEKEHITINPLSDAFYNISRIEKYTLSLNNSFATIEWTDVVDGRKLTVLNIETKEFYVFAPQNFANIKQYVWNSNNTLALTWNSGSKEYEDSPNQLSIWNITQDPYTFSVDEETGQLPLLQNIEDIAWSNDGRYLAFEAQHSTEAVSNDWVFYIWDTVDQEFNLTFNENNARIASIAWSSGNYLAALWNNDGSNNKRFFIWNATTKNKVFSLPDDTIDMTPVSYFQTYAWSKDTDHLFLSWVDTGNTKHAYIWNSSSSDLGFPLDLSIVLQNVSHMQKATWVSNDTKLLIEWRDNASQERFSLLDVSDMNSITVDFAWGPQKYLFTPLFNNAETKIAVEWEDESEVEHLDIIDLSDSANPIEVTTTPETFKTITWSPQGALAFSYQKDDSSDSNIGDDIIIIDGDNNAFAVKNALSSTNEIICYEIAWLSDTKLGVYWKNKETSEIFFSVYNIETQNSQTHSFINTNTMELASLRFINTMYLKNSAPSIVEYDYPSGIISNYDHITNTIHHFTRNDFPSFKEATYVQTFDGQNILFWNSQTDTTTYSFLEKETISSHIEMGNLYSGTYSFSTGGSIAYLKNDEGVPALFKFFDHTDQSITTFAEESQYTSDTTIASIIPDGFLEDLDFVSLSPNKKYCLLHNSELQNTLLLDIEEKNITALSDIQTLQDASWSASNVLAITWVHTDGGNETQKVSILHPADDPIGIITQNFVESDTSQAKIFDMYWNTNGQLTMLWAYGTSSIINNVAILDTTIVSNSEYAFFTFGTYDNQTPECFSIKSATWSPDNKKLAITWFNEELSWSLGGEEDTFNPLFSNQLHLWDYENENIVNIKEMPEFLEKNIQQITSCEWNSSNDLALTWNTKTLITEEEVLTSDIFLPTETSIIKSDNAVEHIIFNDENHYIFTIHWNSNNSLSILWSNTELSTLYSEYVYSLYMQYLLSYLYFGGNITILKEMLGIKNSFNKSIFEQNSILFFSFFNPINNFFNFKPFMTLNRKTIWHKNKNSTTDVLTPIQEHALDNTNVQQLVASGLSYFSPSFQNTENNNEFQTIDFINGIVWNPDGSYVFAKKQTELTSTLIKGNKGSIAQLKEPTIFHGHNMMKRLQNTYNDAKLHNLKYHIGYDAIQLYLQEYLSESSQKQTIIELYMNALHQALYAYIQQKSDDQIFMYLNDLAESIPSHTHENFSNLSLAATDQELLFNLFEKVSNHITELYTYFTE